MKRLLQVCRCLALCVLLMTGCASLSTQREELPDVPDRLWPEMATTSDVIYCAYVTSSLSDWWGEPSNPSWMITDDEDTMNALTLVGLQGIINRTTPEIFFIWDERGLYNRPSDFWLDEIEVSKDRELKDLMKPDEDFERLNYPESGTPVAPPYGNEDLIRKIVTAYQDRFSGVVVYDPDVPDTINLAFSLASLNNLIVVSPQQLSHFTPYFPIYHDFRTTSEEEAWDDTANSLDDIYMWAFDNIWLEKTFSHIGYAACSPKSSDLNPYSKTYENWQCIEKFLPLGLAPRDLMTALQIPVVNLSPEIPDQRKVLEKYLEKAGPGGIVFGVYGLSECESTRLYSTYGLTNAFVLNGNAPLSSGNLSVIGGIKKQARPYQAMISEQRILESLDPSVPAVAALWVSDGDSIQVLMDRGFKGIVEFDKVFGSPASMTINPTLIDLAPVVWNWYVSNTDPTGLVNGFSGAGYAYPGVMDEDVLSVYVANTANYLEKTGLRTLQLDTRYSHIDSDEFSYFLNHLPDELLYGVINLEAGATAQTLPLSFIGKSAIPILTCVDVIEPQQVDHLVKLIFERADAEYTYEVEMCNGWVSEDLAGGETCDQGVLVSDPDASQGQALRYTPETGVWTMAAGGPGITLYPGEYELIYRVKGEPPISESGEPGARLFWGGYTEKGALQYGKHGEYDLDAEVLQPYGEYKEIRIPFTLEKIEHDFNCVVDYYGGAQGEGLYTRFPLVIDTITIRRISPSNIQSIAPIFITCMNPVDQKDVLKMFKQSFESKGGVILSMDELLYSVNPSAMIDLAKEQLGEKHPAVKKAEKLLRKGYPAESLFTVRTALSE
ncbi:MAG: hypothetical protein ACOCJN_06995 [Spirochaetaceae bacterium JB067]